MGLIRKYLLAMHSTLKIIKSELLMSIQGYSNNNILRATDRNSLHINRRRNRSQNRACCGRADKIFRLSAIDALESFQKQVVNSDDFGFLWIVCVFGEVGVELLKVGQDWN